MKITFLGCTSFSKKLLESIIDLPNIFIDSIFTIPELFKISYSQEKVKNTNYADLRPIANKKNIPIYTVNSESGKKMTDYLPVFQRNKPDIILVLGWYYKVPKTIRELAKYGAWGVLASLLPKYAGGAPLVWAIINGEKETGVTLFKLDSGIDDGDIIEQESFPIEDKDTIKEVYEKATEASINILRKALLNIDNIKLKPQDKSKIEVFPQRNPEDGEINLEWPAKRTYNFIRAQSTPYPGAFIKTIDNKKLVIYKARLID